MRLIDADALLDEIGRLKDPTLICQSMEDFYEDMCSRWIDVLNNAPTVQQELLVQVSEVTYSDRVKGEWRPDYRFLHKAWDCSECDYVTSIETNFCPNCGADMRGVSDE